MYLPSATICLHSVQPVHSLKAPGAQCVGQSQWHHEVHGSACTTGRRCCKKINTKGDAAHHAPWHCRMVCRNVASPRTRMLCCEGAARRRRARGGRLASTRIGRLHKCVEKLFGSGRFVGWQVSTKYGHTREQDTHTGKNFIMRYKTGKFASVFGRDAKPLRPSHAHRRHARPSSPRTHAFAAPLELTTG